MLRKAFFKAFFFTLFLLLASVPAFASPVWEGGSIKGAPSDSQAPLFNDMKWFVRRVPVMLYNPLEAERTNNPQDFRTKNSGEIVPGETFHLKGADLVWGELWTKPEWANKSTRFGLNELYIPINPNMVPAKPAGEDVVLVPLDDATIQDAIWVDPKITVPKPEGGAWGEDMSPAVWMIMSIPGRDAFLAQKEGLNTEMAARYEPLFGYEIPAADGSRTYFRALDTFDHGATYYYHLMLNNGPQDENYAVAAAAPPMYDEMSPDGKGFYRGKDWASNLNNDPGSVPGFIGGIKPWCNLKLTGPNEVIGVPGEEKEVEFTAISEAASNVTTDVGTRRDGQDQFDLPVKDLTLPAWGKVPVKLKLKIENKPYTVRVMVDPNETIMEDRYNDNYVDVTIKPVAPDMYVKTLDPGASEETPGSAYTGTVVFGLAADYPGPVKATLLVTNNGYSATASDGTPLNDQVPVEFQPGEEKTFTFTWHGDQGGNTLVAKIHPVNPPDDKDWTNNSKQAFVPEKVTRQSSGGSGNLTLQAYSQVGEDVYGEIVPSMPRDPGTAKFSDTVKATLTIPQPDLNQILPKSITKYNPQVTSWQVLGATVTYPKRADDFTFGHFVPPNGTVTIDMDYQGGELGPDITSVEATASFREDWSTAGAPIYDWDLHDVIPGPTEYPITAEYKVKVKYVYYVSDEDGGKPRPVPGEITVTGTAAANLLVNGTGANSL